MATASVETRDDGPEAAGHQQVAQVDVFEFVGSTAGDETEVDEPEPEVDEPEPEVDEPEVITEPQDEDAASIQSHFIDGAVMHLHPVARPSVRHARRRLRDSIQGITKPAIKRLARRGGVKRLSGMVYDKTREILRVFLETVIRDAVIYTDHARRKTVTSLDIVYALKMQGRMIYGFSS
jgi:histone H3/H4